MRSPARRIQTRSAIPTGPGTTVPHGWVRATDSLKSNTPDGWVADQFGPAWWIGSDDAWAGSSSGVEWSAYGYVPPPYNGGPIGRQDEWGGRPIRSEWLGHRGILPAVTRATNLIVGPVIQTTWRYYTGSANAPESDVRLGTEIVERPLWTTEPQLVGRLPGGTANRPTLPAGKRLGAHDFWRTLLTHAVWWGTAAMLFVEDAFGQPLAGTLRVANPAMWGWTDDGRFVLDPDGGEPLESDFDGYFDAGAYRWRMVLLRNYAPCDGDTPSGALTRAGLILVGTERANSYLASVMKSGVPSGVLKVNVPNTDEGEVAALKSAWMDAHGGTTRSVAVLNAGVDFTALQLSPVDTNVVGLKSALEVDLAHAFNLSASWLDVATGSGSNVTYANLGERRRDLLDHTLAYHGRSMEDMISALLPYGTAMRVDWSGYLATDPSQQLAFVSQGLADGWLTVEEARSRMGLRPLTAEIASETAAGQYTPTPAAVPPPQQQQAIGGTPA